MFHKLFANFFSTTETKTAQCDSAKLLEDKLTKQVIMRTTSIDLIAAMRYFITSIRSLDRYTGGKYFKDDILLNSDLEKWLPTYCDIYHSTANERFNEIEMHASNLIKQLDSDKLLVDEVIAQAMKQKARLIMVVIEVMNASIEVAYNHQNPQQAFDVMLKNIANIELDKLDESQLLDAKQRLNKFSDIKNPDEKQLSVINEWKTIAESITLKEISDKTSHKSAFIK